jgi:hypothetical protein
VPTAGVPLKTPVAGTKVTPDGKVPAIESIGVGEPVAATVKVPAMPSVKLALSALIMTGVRLIVMLKFCVASGAVPFAAVTVPLKVPRAVGMPEIAPADVNVSPVGNEPDETENIIGAEPSAV